MAKIIGIDLGTTNSCVAVIEGGEPTVILNAEGVRTTPSIVAYDDKGECLVGQSAKNQIITNPERTIYSIKRFMGAGYAEVKDYAGKMPYKVLDAGRKVKVKVGDASYSPQEISARVLQKMKQSAEDYLGHEVTDAVITVPAYFNDAQRQATVDAGKIAGLDVKRIVNEPTAAALAYGLDKKKDLKIAVFDLGGGTFDISVLELGDGVFEVKSTNGNTQLGGDDFDEVLIDYLSEEFKQSSGIDIKNDNMALQRLKEAAEKAKKELSTATTTDINLPFITADASGPKHLNISLTRAKFEQLIAKLVDSLRRPCEDAIKDSGFSVGEINEVILVGGSTRVPAVQAVVKEIFQREPGKGVNPDEVVALGAAIQGGILGGDVKDILLLDVTPLSLGIETLGGVMTKLIDRNSTIPAKKSQVFSTAEDNQNAVTINIFQGERSLAKDNRLLGRFDLVDIPPAPRGIPQIEVAFDIDANGILNVSAKDLGTNKENKIRIEAASGLSDNEIEEMVKKAEENKDKDRERKELIDVKNSADSTIYQTEKLLKDNGDKIDGGEKKKIEEALNALKEKQKTEVTSDIQKAIDEVMSASQEASKKLYEEAAKKGAAKADKASSQATGASNADAKNKKKEEGVVDADYEVVDDKK